MNYKTIVYGQLKREVLGGGGGGQKGQGGGFSIFKIRAGCSTLWCPSSS